MASSEGLTSRKLDVTDNKRNLQQSEIAIGKKNMGLIGLINKNVNLLMQMLIFTQKIIDSTHQNLDFYQEKTAETSQFPAFLRTSLGDAGAGVASLLERRRSSA